MTKGYMVECDQNLSAFEPSNLTRRFVIEDYALRYHVTLQMAEKLMMNSVRTVPETAKPRDTAYLKTSDVYNIRRSIDDVQDMVVDANEEGEGMAVGSSEGMRDFQPPRLRQPHVPPLLHTTMTSPFARSSQFATDTYKNRSNYNPFIWPYYAVAGYPHYVSPIAFRGYPVPGNKDHGHLYSRVHGVPAKSAHRVPRATTTVASPSEKRRSASTSRFDEKLVILPEGRSLFVTRRNSENSSTIKLDDTLLNSSDEKKASNGKYIMHVNSCRPSVLVMQKSVDDEREDISVESARGSPEFFADQRVSGSEHNCRCEHDHYATDSDSTTTPPTSPTDECGFSSDSPRSYDSNQDKPHKCRICGRAFRKHSALIIHHRVHSGEKPYKCPECAKNFSISGNLRRHFLIHTGERPYICPECSRAFNNPSHLTRHRRKLHKKQNTDHRK